MRRTLGTTVFSGMLGVTLFGIFLTPVFFFVIDWLSEARVWSSPLFRWINTWVLGTLSLRPVRQLVREPAAARPSPRRSPRSCPNSSPSPNLNSNPCSRSEETPCHDSSSIVRSSRR